MNNRKDNLIYGRNPLKEALRTNRVKLVYLANGFSNNEILSLISNCRVQVNYISNKELDTMCDGVRVCSLFEEQIQENNTHNL